MDLPLGCDFNVLLAPLQSRSSRASLTAFQRINHREAIGCIGNFGSEGPKILVRKFSEKANRKICCFDRNSENSNASKLQSFD